MPHGFHVCSCPCIQQSLINVTRTNAQALRRNKVGGINFLNSPENTAGIEKIQLDPGNGKRKCVDLNYYRKLCETTINEAISDTCDSGNETQPYCDTIDITNELETDNMVFDEDNMRRICAPNGATDEIWIANIINAQFDALLTYWDKLVLQGLLAGLGAFMDGSVIKAIQLFNTINNDAVGPRTRAIANMIDEFDQGAFNGKPNLIGATELNKFVRMITYGTGNAAGQDVGALANEFNFFYDRFLEGVFGQDEFLMIAPGVSQLLTWNRYVGSYQKVSNTFEHSTIVDPMTGIRFDYKMHYNDCTDHYYIKLQQNWELFITPDDGDDSCADTFGVNGLWNYEACDDITDCEDYSLSDLW